MTLPASSPCPCGSSNTYADCCQPLHLGNTAPSAERLMRSRYSAYTLGLVDYLINTTLPAQQANLDRKAMRQWSKQSRWLGLEVIASEATRPDSDQAWVRFIARWQDPNGEKQAHEEHSEFRREQGRWYFIDPNHPLKPGRNSPCPCGSGKKYKQCCL
ncbi:MAG: YchJ family protein [Pseudomonadaceae bacterium]|nr:MAG: YchJ family protein [Pseudomonadaceae bacterium]